MKLTALIIATYISLLTVLPVVTAITSVCNMQTEECCGDDCCKPEQQDNKPTKQDQSGMCNPFQACTYCCGCYISEPTFQVVTVQQINILYPLVTDNFTTDFCSDCFHPPEIV